MCFCRSDRGSRFLNSKQRMIFSRKHKDLHFSASAFWNWTPWEKKEQNLLCHPAVDILGHVAGHQVDWRGPDHISAQSCIVLEAITGTILRKRKGRWRGLYYTWTWDYRAPIVHLTCKNPPEKFEVPQLSEQQPRVCILAALTLFKNETISRSIMKNLQMKPLTCSCF